MANRRFEMYQYRHVIVRMRLGESDRAIAQTGLMGRKKIASIPTLACTRGWLELDNDIPQEAELAACFDQSHARPQTTSLVEPHAKEVKQWAELGIQGTTIYQALVRKYGFAGIGFVPETSFTDHTWHIVYSSGTNGLVAGSTRATGRPLPAIRSIIMSLSVYSKFNRRELIPLLREVSRRR